MPRRGKEERFAVADMVRSYPRAKATFGHTGRSHQVARIEFNGKCRKQFFACSPSCGSRDKVMRQTRKILTELGAQQVRP
jgi:hypothetical protein